MAEEIVTASDRRDILEKWKGDTVCDDGNLDCSSGVANAQYGQPTSRSDLGEFITYSVLSLDSCELLLVWY